MNPLSDSSDWGQELKPLTAVPTPPPLVPPPVEGSVARRQVLFAPPKTEEQRDAGPANEQSPSWLTSILLHLLLLFLLTVIAPVTSVSDRMTLVVALSERESTNEVEIAELTLVEQPELEIEPIEQAVEIEKLFPDTEIIQSNIVQLDTLLPRLVDPMSDLTFHSEPKTLMQLPPVAGRSSHATGNHSKTAMSGAPGSGGGNHAAHGELGGRALRRWQFATDDMNYAINHGLNWLARHQLADGGWSFDHQIGECQGRCGDPGSKRNARVAATGLALLPFLGAGHSPLHGEYRETVSAGINYLIANTSRNGSLCFSQGQMYGHGIATLALCECYGIMKHTPPHGRENAASPMPYSAYPPMTNTPRQAVAMQGAVDIERLERTAIAAIEFIVRAQAQDGGWRYQPRELGDTSVVGWQVMALKSAKEAGLDVNPKTVAAAGHFLNLVQRDPLSDSSGPLGTRYAYMPDKRKFTPATTAIGHACRICMGASPFHPAIQTTVKEMAASGHRGGDMYYNFYANQVIFQHGGTPWTMWSQQLNNDLIGLQEQRGHLQGSWHFGAADSGGIAGGRLYATAMSCLCLEETFRHLPAFRINAERKFAERFQAAMATAPEDKAFAAGNAALNDEPNPPFKLEPDQAE